MATTLLGLGVLYVYNEAVSARIAKFTRRRRLGRSIGILKPDLLDFMSSIERFVNRDRTGSFVRMVEDINQLLPLQERRIVVADTAHLYTIVRFGEAVRAQINAATDGEEFLAAAKNAYQVFWEYNSLVGQAHNRLQSAVQQLTRPVSAGQDRAREDEALRVIRTKWNSFRDLQNALVQSCLQLGDKLRRETGEHGWGTHLDHFQTIE